MPAKKVILEISKPITFKVIDWDNVSPKNFKKEFKTLNKIELSANLGGRSVGFAANKFKNEKIEIKKSKNKAEISGSVEMSIAVKNNYLDQFEEGMKKKTIVFGGISYLTGDDHSTMCQLADDDTDKNKTKYTLKVK